MSEVTIYSLPACPHCKAAKQFFEDQNIPYKDVNLNKDKEAMQEIVKKGFKSAPIIKIDDEYLPGFDAKKIKELLNK